jgi:putative addiction module component (TIGR02574 family)
MDAVQMDAILQLDVDERIRIVQIIWDSIAASVDTMPLTAAEKTTARSSRRRRRRRSRPW